MDPINAEAVEKAWQDLAQMTTDTTVKLVNDMGRVQPSILAYLMATGEAYLATEEQEVMLYLGLAVWQMMLQGGPPLPRVEEEVLNEHEENNIKMLEYLAGDSESDFVDTVETIFANYNQPEVLRYVVESLMEDPGHGVELSEESKGHMLICLKTVIDCFDSVGSPV